MGTEMTDLSAGLSMIFDCHGNNLDELTIVAEICNVA